MAATKSAKLQSLAVVLTPGENLLPRPTTIADGGALDAWKNGQYAPDFASIAIDADAAGTLTAPVELIGYDAEDAVWRLLGILNAGSDIVLTATVGFEQRVRDVGVFDRLDVACAATTAVTLYTITAKPIEVIGTGG